MAPIDDIARIVTQAIINALKDREQELTRIAEAGGDKAGSGTWGTVGSIVGIISDVVNAVPVIAEVLSLPLEPLKLVEDAAGEGGKAFGIGYLLGNVAFGALDPIMQPLDHAIANALQTGIFDPQTAAMLQAKGIIDEAYGRSEAAGGNLSGEHYDKLVAATVERADYTVALDAWLKGLVTEAQVDEALHHAGIIEEWWAPIKALRRAFLSPADLALANLRGAITPETMQGYANQLGMTPDDMQVLVANTGEPPGLMELLFLFRRGQIDQERLTRGVRQSRVRDEWMDAILKLRYAPMTVADAARACVEGYMAPEAGADIAQQNGLDAAHWPIILESWGRPLSHEQMLTLMHRGQATRPEVVQAMKESDIKDKYIDKAIELGRALIPERLIVTAVQHNVMTHAEAHTALTERGYIDADADILIALGGAQRTSATHALSRTDIVAMYSDSLLTRDRALADLTKLGYPQADADALLKLADTKSAATARRTAQRAVEASLKAHHLTQQQAINQLEGAGIAPAQARGLVDEWMAQRGVATKSLTEAQILKLGEAQFITGDDVLTRLQAFGLSQGDALLLMRLNGITQGEGLGPIVSEG